VIDEGRFEVNPSPNLSLKKGSLIVVVGSNKDINRLPT
jgi:trk system potassium uptake protein TrkA